MKQKNRPLIKKFLKKCKKGVVGFESVLYNINN